MIMFRYFKINVTFGVNYVSRSKGNVVCVWSWGISLLLPIFVPSLQVAGPSPPDIWFHLDGVWVGTQEEMGFLE